VRLLLLADVSKSSKQRSSRIKGDSQQGIVDADPKMAMSNAKHKKIEDHFYEYELLLVVDVDMVAKVLIGYR
jgi:hypothetical protein